MKFNPLKLKFRRIRSQEGGAVFRWYEADRGNIIASIVQGNIENELEFRISDGKGRFNSVNVRGSKRIISGKTDMQHKRKIKRVINSEFKFGDLRR